MSHTPLTPALVPSLFSVARWARFLRSLNNANLYDWNAQAPQLEPAYAGVVKAEYTYRYGHFYRRGGGQGWRE